MRPASATRHRSATSIRSDYNSSEQQYRDEEEEEKDDRHDEYDEYEMSSESTNYSVATSTKSSHRTSAARLRKGDERELLEEEKYDDDEQQVITTADLVPSESSSVRPAASSPHCQCDSHRSLRCHTSILSQLHHSLPTPSEFTLGNLKSRATRIVIPPSVVYYSRSGGGSGAVGKQTATEMFFTSTKTGGILRKQSSHVTPASIMQDFLSYHRRSLAEALTTLDLKSKERRQRAWKMEEEMSEVDELTKAFMSDLIRKREVTVEEHVKKPISMLAKSSSSQKKLLQQRSKSAFGSSSTAHSSTSSLHNQVQNPITSSPSTPPQQHCDIIAQFTFASDSKRYDDPQLPYTLLSTYGSDIPSPHDFPDILYLNIRSLYHFLHVVNSDLSQPKAQGVLAVFVRGDDEKGRNRVFRVMYSLSDSEGSTATTNYSVESKKSHAQQPSRSPSSKSLPSFINPSPQNYHISLSCRINVLPLIDTSAITHNKSVRAASSPSTTAHVFTLAERAATFDAAHVSTEGVEKRGGDGGRKEDGEKGEDNNNNKNATGKSLHTLILPSGYPFSPSPHCSAQRVQVPTPLQARLEASMLRIVSHLDDQHRFKERELMEKRYEEMRIQKEVYQEKRKREVSSSSSIFLSAPPMLPSPPQTRVGYMEAYFKLDDTTTKKNNGEGDLYLIGMRSVREVTKSEGGDAQSTLAPTTTIQIYCTQCLLPCSTLQPISLLPPPSLPPPHELSQDYTTPFYASRFGRTDERDQEEEREERKKRREKKLAEPRYGKLHQEGKSQIEYVNQRLRKKKGEKDDGIVSKRNDNLWPESHFDRVREEEEKEERQSARRNNEKVELFTSFSKLSPSTAVTSTSEKPTLSDFVSIYAPPSSSAVKAREKAKSRPTSAGQALRRMRALVDGTPNYMRATESNELASGKRGSSRPTSATVSATKTNPTTAVTKSSPTAVSSHAYRFYNVHFTETTPPLPQRTRPASASTPSTAGTTSTDAWREVTLLYPTMSSATRECATISPGTSSSSIHDAAIQNGKHEEECEEGLAFEIEECE